MKRCRILLVDDEEDLLEEIAECMERLGYDVTTARDVDSAICKVDADPFDAVVTDMRMPGQDGLALLRHLESTRSNARVMIITGHWQDPLGEDTVELDYRILKKPFTAAELEQELERLLAAR